MNLLMQFLIATTLIAALGLLRLIADRCALLQRLRGAHSKSECEQAGCLRGCDVYQAAPDQHSVATKDTTNRSKYHAH